MDVSCAMEAVWQHALNARLHQLMWVTSKLLISIPARLFVRQGNIPINFSWLANIALHLVWLAILRILTAKLARMSQESLTSTWTISAWSIAPVAITVKSRIIPVYFALQAALFARVVLWLNARNARQKELHHISLYLGQQFVRQAVRLGNIAMSLPIVALSVILTAWRVSELQQTARAAGWQQQESGFSLRVASAYKVAQ